MYLGQKNPADWGGSEKVFCVSIILHYAKVDDYFRSDKLSVGNTNGAIPDKAVSVPI